MTSTPFIVPVHIFDAFLRRAAAMCNVLHPSQDGSLKKDIISFVFMMTDRILTYVCVNAILKSIVVCKYPLFLNQSFINTVSMAVHTSYFCIALIDISSFLFIRWAIPRVCDVFSLQFCFAIAPTPHLFLFFTFILITQKGSGNCNKYHSRISLLSSASW